MIRPAAALLLLLALASAAPAGDAAAPVWPEGLAEAARAHRDRMEAEAEAVRASTPEAPRGVTPVLAFERDSHLCHEVDGQIYRTFGEPRLEAVEEAGGAVRVRYPFRLFYRRDTENEKLFVRPWSEGSDGFWEVRFERVAERWTAVGEKEVLDLVTPGGQPGHR